MTGYFSLGYSALVRIGAIIGLLACASFADEVTINTLTYFDVTITQVAGENITFQTPAGKDITKPLTNVTRVRLKDAPLFNKAEKLVQEGKFDEAIETYTKCLAEAEKQRAEAREKYLRYSRLGQIEEANKLLSKLKPGCREKLMESRRDTATAWKDEGPPAHATKKDSPGALPDGKRYCTACRGRGKIKCPACKGSGRTKCPQCRGNWYRACNFCNGKGKTPYNDYYYYYYPSGRSELRRRTRYRDCPYCTVIYIPATGKKVGVRQQCGCAKNKYPGYVTCPTCRGAARQTCARCQGKGKIDASPNPLVENPEKKPPFGGTGGWEEDKTSDVPRKIKDVKLPGDIEIRKKPREQVDVSKLDPLESADNMAAVLKHKIAPPKHPRELPGWHEMTSLQKEEAEEAYRKTLEKHQPLKSDEYAGKSVEWTLRVKDIVKSKDGKAYVVTATSKGGCAVIARFSVEKRETLVKFKKNDDVKISGIIETHELPKPRDPSFFGVGPEPSLTVYLKDGAIAATK